jgi:predicted MFS family arabinose efflux permease
LLLLAVSIALLAGVHSTVTLAGTGLLFGTAQGFVYPTLNAFTVDQAAAGQLGRVQALYNGTFNLGVTLGSVALGPVVHDLGHRVMFLCSAGAALGALAVFGLGARRVG